MTKFRDIPGTKFFPWSLKARNKRSRPGGSFSTPAQLALKAPNPARVATPSACYSGPKPPNSQKWLGEGAKGVFEPREQRSPESLLHHPKPCFAPVQLSFAPMQEAFGALGPKDLLHPLLTTFGNFEVSGRCSRTFESQRQGVWSSDPNIFLSATHGRTSAERQTRGAGSKAQL